MYKIYAPFASFLEVKNSNTLPWVLKKRKIRVFFNKNINILKLNYLFNVIVKMMEQCNIIAA